MHFLYEYGLFLAKIMTVVIALLLIIGFVAAQKNKIKEKGKLCIRKLNDHFKEVQNQINSTILNKAEQKAYKKELAQQKKKIKTTEPRQRIFVFDFQGDIRASAVASLQEIVSAILLTAKPQDQVLIRLESAGGMVHAYGLAAAQLQRIKDAQIRLIITVDKVAASGGYLMACLADQLIAAPFAIVGSIGVIAQIPNLHRFLQNRDVDFEQITAGEYKRTLSIFGENTEKGREKMQEEIDDTHELFKAFVQNYRPQIQIEKVATGEHWFAKRTVELGLNLIDTIKTSEDYILAHHKQCDIYELNYQTKQPLMKRIGIGVQTLIFKLFHLRQSETGQDFI